MIRRARRDGLGEMMKERRERIKKGSREGIEKRGRDKKTIRRGGPEISCFFKSSGYDKLELKHQNLVFTSL